MTDEQIESDNTVDRPDEAMLREACRRFVELGDAGIFMTCDSDSEMDDYRICLRCKSLKDAQQIHRALIDIVACVRDAQPAKCKPTSRSAEEIEWIRAVGRGDSRQPGTDRFDRPRK